jgi:hypothetical protein
MTVFFERLDRLAGIDPPSVPARWLERVAFIFLLLMVVAAPHSIAVSQGAWLLGSLATAIRFLIRPRPPFKFGGLGVALPALFLWSVVSSLCSYEPAISLDKLRGVALFLVFFFAALNLRQLRAIYLTVFLLIFSCMFNVVWSIADRAVGRGIEVYGIVPDGPLGKAGIIDGDTILTVNGRRVRSIDQLRTAIDSNDSVTAQVYRPEAYLTFELRRSELSPTIDPSNEALGIVAWNIGRNWRTQGFYSHFTTYAEMLQLVASLLLGLIVGSLVGRNRQTRNTALRVLTSTPVMTVALAAMLIVLLLTVTRASQLAFMVSAFSVIVISGSRKLLLAAAIIAIPIAFAGLLFLQQSRNIGFVDPKDESTRYRLVMWNDGLRLSTSNPRNFVFGVGMDSIKKRWPEWGMFDGGRLPVFHFHSTPIQLLVERGVPALSIWLIVLAIYARTLWRGIEASKRVVENEEKWTLGVLLGCLGGLVGFFVSGLVHYNLGDGEVAMVFYLLMAIGIRTAQLTQADIPESATEQRVEYRLAA